MKKLLLVVPGYCVGLGGLLLMTYRTLLAFRSQSGTITVHVNRFGEQHLDLVGLVVLWVVCMLGFVSLALLVRQHTPVHRQDSTMVSQHDRSIAPTSSALSADVLRMPACVPAYCAGVPLSSETLWIVPSDDAMHRAHSVTVTVFQKDFSEKKI